MVPSRLIFAVKSMICRVNNCDLHDPKPMFFAFRLLPYCYLSCTIHIVPHTSFKSHFVRHHVMTSRVVVIWLLSRVLHIVGRGEKFVCKHQCLNLVEWRNRFDEVVRSKKCYSVELSFISTSPEKNDEVSLDFFRFFSNIFVDKSQDSLEELKLRNIEMKMTTRSIFLLLQSLKNCQRFRGLTMVSCGLTDEHVPFISDLFGHNNIVMKQVDLRRNSLTSNAIRFLFKMTHVTVTKLESLDLSYNPIGSEGVQLLAMLISLGYFPNLRRLMLRSVDADQMAVTTLLTSIDSALADNVSSIEYLDVSGNFHWSKFDYFSSDVQDVVLEQRSPLISSIQELIQVVLTKKEKFYNLGYPFTLLMIDKSISYPAGGIYGLNEKCSRIPSYLSFKV